MSRRGRERSGRRYSEIGRLVPGEEGVVWKFQKIQKRWLAVLRSAQSAVLAP
jgi:hypothetical protein